jgi:hypothetical protein
MATIAFVVIASIIALPSCATTPQRAFEMELMLGDGSEPVRVPEPLQRATAFHEAGHALATIGYFGPGSVGGVQVRTACCGGDISYDVGSTNTVVQRDKATPDDLMKAMIVLYAGLESEVHFFGAEHTDDSLSDMNKVKHLAEAYVKLRTHQGYVVKDAGIMAARTRQCAQATARLMVLRNTETIRTLAGAIMAQPEVNHLRLLKDPALIVSGVLIVIPEVQCAL